MPTVITSRVSLPHRFQLNHQRGLLPQRIKLVLRKPILTLGLKMHIKME